MKKYAIRGVLWRFRRSRAGLGPRKEWPKGAWGVCETAPAREITVRPSGDFESTEKEVDTVVHECLHAAFPHLSEKTVTELATELTAILSDQFNITPKK